MHLQAKGGVSASTNRYDGEVCEADTCLGERGWMAEMPFHHLEDQLIKLVIVSSAIYR